VKTYLSKLQSSIARSGTNLCIGLDPDLERIPSDFLPKSRPEERISAFCKKIIDLTRPYAAAYKPNTAFFEALGAPAFEILSDVVQYVGPEIPVIADAKRGDIGNTGRHYRLAFFEALQADAITLSPWMGIDTLLPYLDAPGKAVYVLVLTSNPGAETFMMAPRHDGTMALYLSGKLRKLAETSETHIGAVLGATRPETMTPFLDALPDSSILVPGFGAQGGDAETVTNVLRNRLAPPLLSVSRDILYAPAVNTDWTEAVVSAAKKWARQLSIQHANESVA
jgi:orotidine-5'-phosphate decarboxylase